MTEQAAQDPNMPQLDEAEVTATTETEVTAGTEGQAETAPATVDGDKGDFVSPDEISEKTQSRINKITAEKYAEKRRADDLERQLNEVKPHVTQTPTQNAAEPKLEDFDYDEAAHTSALIDYRVDLKADQIQQQAQQAQTQAQAKQVSNDFNSKVATFAEKATDYEQVVANIPELPEKTLNAIMQHEKGPEMAYYLGKHLDVADSIATADPMTAAIQLGQISAQLTATPKTVVTSAAPDPIEPVGSSGISNKAQEDMSMSEIYAME